jgi:hypothetical protein
MDILHNLMIDNLLFKLNSVLPFFTHLHNYVINKIKSSKYFYSATKDTRNRIS